MALKKVRFQPGFDKQGTPSASPGKWIDGDFVRFRYGIPEKIGGWQQLTNDQHTLPGVARAQHAFTSLAGEKYAAIGTSQGLFLYYGGAFYDISPLDTTLAGTGTFTTSAAAGATVTINFTSHGLEPGRYIVLSSVSMGANTTLTADDFTVHPFEILTTTSNSFTISLTNPAAGVTTTENNVTGMSNGGSLQISPYAEVGPTTQTLGYGWGTYLWGDSTWGTARTTSNVILEPGNWSLDNFGETLIATIANGKSFTWDAGAVNPRNNRATLMTGAPTASRLTIVSETDRHLFHLGTETTIGNASTQDPMFIRFSDQESTSVYAPTATNTAGTFQLDKGNKIVAAVQGKDYILILTDQAAYIAQFVGPPFTFSIRQVGTNCGCLGQHALAFAQGAVYWMGTSGGFFQYDGTVKQLPCLVEDFVFTTGDGNLGLNFNSSEIVYAGHNSLYTEVNWFYPKSGSSQIDRVVTYNYGEASWYTGSLDRTTYQDSDVFTEPYATNYVGKDESGTNDPSDTPLFPISGITNKYGATVYYEHETGTDQINSTGTSAIAAFIRSSDFDIDDGEFLMSIRRFIPDYKQIVGNSLISLFISDFPSQTQSVSPLGPFTVTSTTTKIDTRARGRLLSVKIENESVGETWRYGSLRLDAQPDGRR
jgi:hypothetical protein